MNLERINALWDALEFPTEARLAMATKYSQPSTGQWLPDALDAWERTLAAVQARQNLLDEYAEFERAGSDPRRLIRGSSTNRLLEEKTRKVFARKIAASAKAITDLNTYLFKTFGDVLLVRGEPYLQIMPHEVSSILFALEEERLAM